MRICSTCATKTEETGRFCPECGATLRELAAAAEPGPGLADTAQLADSIVGTTLDHQFAVEAVLGGGSFGTVYRGRQLELERAVAIKIPTREIASEPVMAKRFAREARAAARVSHPGVVQIFAVGELADKRPYMAMQLVDGRPLDAILEGGPIAPVRALRLARQIASALAETHAEGVVHRDLKPTNIIWRRDRGGDDRITIVDFGIAVCRPGTADATRLTNGGLVGTPHYMSPEQAHGDEVDARADLYALGCLIFELVTNTTPFDGSGFEVLLAHMGRAVPPPSSRNPDVPDVVDRLVAALTKKKPSERPPTADAVVAQLDDALAELAGGAPAPSLPRPRPRQKTQPTLVDSTRARRRQRTWIAAAVAAVALAGATIGGYQLGAARGGAGAAAANHPDPKHPRVFVDDEGETLMRVVLPESIVAGADTYAHLKLANKLGQPVVASQIVVTITTPAGDAKGVVATPRSEPGHYELRYAFPAPGHYVVRIFPPVGPDTAFELSVDVR